MVVHGCIEIHLNGCGGWIIVMGFRVLLITHYLIREILMETVLDVHASGVKIKNFIDTNVVTMHLLQKKGSWRNTCVGMHTENHMFLTFMVERMVGSTSSASNVHRVVDDNSNLYRNMVMDGIRMNQGHAGQCPILDEENNVDAARFFDLLKDSNKPLWDGYINHSNISRCTGVYHQVGSEVE
jgi:hypothetical protein